MLLREGCGVKLLKIKLLHLYFWKNLNTDRYLHVLQNQLSYTLNDLPLI